MTTTAEVRSVIVGGQQMRVAVRPDRAAAAGRPPLLLINGTGTPGPPTERPGAKRGCVIYATKGSAR